MMTCNEARAQLALSADFNDADANLHQHLAECAACAAYRRRNSAIDAALRDELRWEVPSVLTAQLMAIALQGSYLTPVARPRRWYVIVVYILTLLVMGVSLALAWQIGAIVAMQIGLGDMLNQMLAAPSQWLAQLSQSLPQSQAVIDFALRVRDQLLWLLLAAVLWAALDRAPQSSFART